MTNQKILEKALLKAHKNGWEPLNLDWRNVHIEQWQDKALVGIALLYSQEDVSVRWVRELEGIIYNRDFAKALWGDYNSTYSTGGPKPITKWQRHLQQMVIADDPVQYLGENL